MASSNDLDGLVLPGPYIRDTIFGYQDANSLVDNDTTLSNVIQQIHQSNGQPNTAHFARAEAVYYKSGSQFDLAQGTTPDILWPATISIGSTGIIDIAFNYALPTANYGVHVTPGYTSQLAIMQWDTNASYKTTTGLRIYCWALSTSPTAVNVDAFTISLYYDGT